MILELTIQSWCRFQQIRSWSPTRLPSFRYHLQDWNLQFTCSSGQLNSRFPVTPLGLIIQQNDIQNSIQQYINDYNFIIKHTIQGQSQKETHQVRLERVLSTELSCVQPEGFRCVILLVPKCVHQPGSSPHPQCPEFLLRFHCVSMIDFLFGHMTGLHLQLLSPPQMSGGLADITWLKATNL